MWHTVVQHGLVHPKAGQANHDEPSLGIQILQNLVTNDLVDTSDAHVKFVGWKWLRIVPDSVGIEEIAIDLVSQLSGKRKVCNLGLVLRRRGELEWLKCLVSTSARSYR